MWPARLTQRLNLDLAAERDDRRCGVAGSISLKRTTILRAHTNKSAVSVLGAVDAVKVQSCMTVLDCISPDDIFSNVLDSFYNGKRYKNSSI